MTSYEDASFELTTESGHSTRSTEHRSTSASSVSTIDDHDQDDPLLSTHTASVPPNPHSPLAAAALASGEWKVQHDHTTGKDYYYHAATKKTTWDLNKELAHTHSSDSSVREVSQPASTVESHPETIETSVDTGDGERKRAGHMAEANDEYNHLTGFVAFNSQGTPSIPRSSVAVSSKSPSKVTMSERLSVSVPRDDAKAEELSTTAVEQPTEANPSSVGGGLPPSKDVETSLLASITPSSAFSTLSQHLKKDIGSTPADAMAPTGILPRSSMKEPSPQPTSPAGIAATATLEIAAASPTSPSTFSSEAKPTIQVLTTEVPHTAGPISVASSSPVVEVTSGPLGTATAPRSQSYGLPVLPPSSFSTSHARSSPSAASPTSMYPARMSPGPVGGTRSDGGSGFASYPTHEHSSLPQTSAPMMVMNNNNSNTNDPKLLELREASEAVERLVKAFAYLRGHMGDDQPSTERSTAFASTAVEDRRTSPAHAMGNPSTVKATSLRPRAGTATRLPLARPVLSEDEAAAMQANAALLEETVMECVVELIQREGAQRQAAKDAAAPVAARLARRSQKEVVSADSYRIDAPSRRPCGDGMGRAVQIAAFFDEALASEDGDANTSLFHSIQDGLEKYLLRHVVDTAAGEVSNPSPGLAAYAVTAQFAWTLLVDLVSVCCDITEQCFGADGMPLNRMTTPILVKYDGERECEQIARNTIHCLPFELLQTAGGLGSDGLSSPVGKSVYRLDYWVTRPKMWVVIEALLNVLRRQMLLHARRNQYYPFRVDPEMAGKINIRSVVPPVAPMFVLQPMARTEEHMEEVETNAHHSRLTGPSPRAKPHIRGRNTENDDDELHVSEGAMQTMSLMISEVSTNILTENPAMKELHDAKDYRELTSVVAETMQELLADASVNTAIQRRAADVFLKRRAEQLSSTDTRADRRERERLVVKKAEEEAERVVRRILQEMRVEEVRGAS